jgi:hypothetical protein
MVDRRSEMKRAVFDRVEIIRRVASRTILRW